MADKEYLKLMQFILDNGVRKSDRTGVGTISVFGYQMRFDLREFFPLLTTKKVFWRGVVEELLWFLRGETDSKILEARGVNIWRGNTSREFLDKRGLVNYPEGEIGPCYGFQWRNFGGTYHPYAFVSLGDDGLKFSYPDRGRAIHKENNGIDQISGVIESIKNDPDSRRHIMTTWNPFQLDDMALHPCHGIVTQFYVYNGELSCHMYQRSVDTFLGLPFNIASYALLTHIVAKVSGLRAGDFVWSGGDVHIYLNHLDAVKEQMSREPYISPKLKIKKELNSVKDIEDMTYNDVELIDYKCHKSIKAKMAV